MSAPRPTSARPVSLVELAGLAGAAEVAQFADIDVTGVTLDSRAVQPGDLYAALPGARVHGADFAAAAVAAGAVAVLTDPAGAGRVGGLGTPLLVVDRPRAVLGALAARIMRTERSTLRLVGVTGTNGKTTVAHLLHSALTALHRRPGLIGTVETRLGTDRMASVRTTPEAPELHALLAVMAERGLDTCVMEVSSHALAQHRVDGVRYDVALFTNLSQDHLDFHADMEDYFAAKASLFTPERARRGVVCIDDEWGRRLAAGGSIPLETLTTRADLDADWRVTRSDDDPSAFVLHGPGAILRLRSGIPGDFNLTNTALAAAALVRLGEPVRDVERAVRATPYVPGRMEVVRAPAGVVAPRAVVDYAHTPDAIRAALTALRPTTPGRLVCVTGAGGDRDRDKRQAMGAAAAGVADVVVVTDDNPRSEDAGAIRAAVLAGAESAAQARAAVVLEVGDRRSAIRTAVDAVWPDGPAATVAVVGKGHETGQEVAGTVYPFDDRDELREALRLAAEVPAR
ncbi:MAG: UDP-N-acetylmuramoyl-L-alanyl-D-glutamate--2,6-diaminopimelate ligase [Dermatophilaceae bacterium]